MHVVLLGTLALPQVSCKRQERHEPGDAPLAVPMLGEVHVQHMGDEVPAGVRFDDPALTTAARAQLERAEIFAHGEATAGEVVPPKANVLVGYAVEKVWVEGKGLARAQVQLRVAVKPHQAADPYWAEDVEASGEMPYETRSEGEAPPRAFTALVSRMITDLLAEYMARQKLRTASPERLLQVMQQGSGATREDAIRLAGQRQVKEAVEPLLRLLTDDEEPIRDAALGALVKLKEKRAVTVLAKSRSMRDTREMRKILTAIALLGGDEAIDYLKFVLAAHEDEEIRSLAREALERLED